MNEADRVLLQHKELTHKIIGVFNEVYDELGHGFLESVYQRSLTIALRASGLEARAEVKIPVWFRGERVGQFEGDLLVNNSILLELKVAQCLNFSHQAQLLNYLRATNIEIGLLLNFGIKPEFRMLTFENTRKTIRAKGS